MFCVWFVCSVWRVNNPSPTGSIDLPPPPPSHVQAGQRRRFLLYAGIIAFRTAVLLICLNRLQAHLQGAYVPSHSWVDGWARQGWLCV